jgi:two-component system cell cycle response regulator
LSEAMRVILVGDTGVDGRLRRSDAMEVVRAKSPLEAIGHVSRRSSALASKCVVLVGADSDLDEPVSLRIDHGGTSTPRVSNLTRFISGLRTVDSSVRVVRVRDGAEVGGNNGESGFDASISTGADAAALERVIRGEAAVAPRPAAPVAPTPPPVKPEAPVAGEVGDESMLEHLARAGELIEAGVRLISARVGASVRYLAAGESPPMGPSAKVTIGEQVVGHLCGAVDPAKLLPHARWLAGWMQLQRSQARLRHVAMTDPLTGAWNRRYFDRFLKVAMENARAHRRHVTVLLFDIDDFKRYNDEFGHDAGDEILVETVKLMRSVIRPSDRVCRIGGDEFAVIFHDPEGPRTEGSSNAVSVVEVANRFRRQVHEHKFPKLGTHAKGTLTISGGMASFPWDGATPAELLTRADMLARDSKRAGKNVITFGAGAHKAGTDASM